MKVSLIVLEKENQFYFYYPDHEEYGGKIFGLSKTDDGDYPLFSLDDFILAVKNNPQYR
jgi:hypothetical protein